MASRPSIFPLSSANSVLYSAQKKFGNCLIALLFPYKNCGCKVRRFKSICWSKNAERELARIEPHAKKRILHKFSEFNDRSAPPPDIRKLTIPENHYRLRVGNYRIVFTIRGDAYDECLVISVKRRTSTTYLHEEIVPYGCSANSG